MKQPKKLTRAQKKLVSKCGLNADDWMCTFENLSYLYIYHKETSEIKVINKEKCEVIKYEN